MDAGDRFIEDHEALVRGVARKLKAQLDLVAELDDLVAAGFSGLVEARTRFDPARGTQFSTFAYYRIRGAIIDHVRRSSVLSRRAYEHVRLAEATDRIAEDVATTRASDPSTDALDAVNAIDSAVSRLTSSFVLSCVGPSPEDAPATPEDRLVARESEARLREAVDSLPNRERALIVGHYFEGRRFEEVASELGVSKSWASRMHAKALDQLREALRSE